MLTLLKRLQLIKEKHGPESILVGWRGSLNNEFAKAFARGLGTPNDFTHPQQRLSLSLHTACQATLGVGRKAIGFDIENAEYVVLYGRNIYESLTVAEVNQLMTAMDNGGQDRNGGSEGLKNRGEITLLGEDKAGDRLGFQSGLDERNHQKQTVRRYLRE